MSAENGEDFVKLLQEELQKKVDDPNTEWGTGKLLFFNSSSQPNVWWKPYIGDRKCDMCKEATADVYATGKQEKILAFSCNKCEFKFEFKQ